MLVWYPALELWVYRCSAPNDVAEAEDDSAEPQAPGPKIVRLDATLGSGVATQAVSEWLSGMKMH